MKRVPDRLELKRLLDKGLTQKEIAERFGVSRSAIAMAKMTYGLEAGKTRERFADMLPWTLQPEHRMHWDARMLRLEARRQRGQDLTDDELRWLQGWRSDLDEKNAVVMYNGRTREGFHWVPRRDEDEGSVIRRPEE